MGSTHRSWQIGDVRVTRIVESVAPLPAAGLFPDAKPEDLEPHLDWLAPHFVDDERNLLLSIHGLVVESAGRRILVDTCIGEHAIPGMEGLGGESGFFRELEAAGFAAGSIDTVLCTHLHFDHVGWNTRREGDRWVPSFPNARYLFARVEFEHWRAEAERPFAATFDDAVLPIVDAGLADLVETNHRITDEVWLEATPGHTPGHVAVRIESRGDSAFVTGDLTHHPVQWAELDWRMGADSDSEQAAATRRRLLAEHADRPTLVIGTHYAGPSSGWLVGDGRGGHRFAASSD